MNAVKETIFELDKNFISLVVYLKNDEERITPFYKMVINLMKGNFLNYELIFVNDNSSDNTMKVLKDISKQQADSITIVNLNASHGVETAMLAGVDNAIGDFVFEFDSTVLAYDANSILDAYKTALAGYDIVSCGPENSQKIGSGLFYWLFRRYSDEHFSFKTEWFRLLSRRAINRINQLGNLIVYRKAAYYNCGLDTKHICVKQNKEEQVYKRGNFEERLTLAKNAILLFTNVGARLSFGLSAIMIIFSIAVGVWALWVRLASVGVVEGWTAIMVFLSLSFSGLFILLTFLLEYVSLILKLQIKQQNYTIKGIERI